MECDGNPTPDYEDDSASLVTILNCRLPRELLVTVVDGGREVQSQWEVQIFLSKLFTTSDEDSLRQHFINKSAEIERIHQHIWPGVSVPALLKSKHEVMHPAENQIRNNICGPVYLKRKTMPTSLAMSWLVWSVSKNKRMAVDRLKSQVFARELLSYALEKAGTWNFNIQTVGNSRAGIVTAQISTRNDCFDYRVLWEPKLKGRIVSLWESRRVAGGLTSNWDRPQWIDFILFALDPTNSTVPQLLSSVACSLLAQVAFWMDTNIGKLAIDGDDIRQARQKNQREQKFVTQHAMIEAASFLLFENDASVLTFSVLFSCGFFFQGKLQNESRQSRAKKIYFII